MSSNPMRRSCFPVSHSCSPPYIFMIVDQGANADDKFDLDFKLHLNLSLCSNVSFIFHVSNPREISPPY